MKFNILRCALFCSNLGSKRHDTCNCFCSSRCILRWWKNGNYYLYLPEHNCGLQSTGCEKSVPSQLMISVVSGSSHDRVRVWVPPPHVTEHPPSTHSFQVASNYNMYSIKVLVNVCIIIIALNLQTYRDHRVTGALNLNFGNGFRCINLTLKEIVKICPRLECKQYMDELRAKCAANFEARMYKTVWNYDMHANVLQIKEYWAINVQQYMYMEKCIALCESMTCTRSAVQNN